MSQNKLNRKNKKSVYRVVMTFVAALVLFAILSASCVQTFYGKCLEDPCHHDSCSVYVDQLERELGEERLLDCTWYYLMQNETCDGDIEWDGDVEPDADTDFEVDAEEIPDSESETESDEEVCEPRHQLACNEENDVIWLDSCGEPEDGLVEDCADLRGVCVDGVCGCEEGWRGKRCDQCLTFVNAATGSDENTGRSWAQALATVTAGLDNASDFGCDVWVAAGTYYPTDGISRNATFQLVSGVGLYGGFSGTELNFDERGIEANPTILSGDIDRDGILDDGNVYHVVTGADDAILDGFMITEGNANHPSDDDPRAHGGGMYNESVYPTLRNCIFFSNFARRRGGGMYNSTASPSISDCTFSQNEALYGAGMNNAFLSSPSIVNCTFSENSASGYGGGMVNSSSEPTVVDCEFIENDARQWAGGMSNHSASPELINCVFSNNNVLIYDGGGMHNHGSSPSVTNCTFVFNNARNGVSISNYNESSPTIVNSILWGSLASSGNQIYSQDSELDVPTVTYSNVRGGYDGEGNMSSDPRLDGSMRLRNGSPCIDSGDNSHVEDVTTDADGNPRIIDGDGDGSGVVDLGAYEFHF